MAIATYLKYNSTTITITIITTTASNPPITPPATAPAEPPSLPPSESTGAVKSINELVIYCTQLYLTNLLGNVHKMFSHIGEMLAI